MAQQHPPRDLVRGAVRARMAQARPGASAAHHLPDPLARRARRERLDSVIAAERRAEAPAKVRLLPKVPIHLMMLVSNLAFAAEARSS